MGDHDNIVVSDTRPKMPELSHTCQRVGCDKPSAFRPVLKIWAVGDWKKRPKTALRMEIGLSVCAEHAKTAQASDFITDESWKLLVSAVVDVAKKAEPSRESVVVEMVPIGVNN